MWTARAKEREKERELERERRKASIEVRLSRTAPSQSPARIELLFGARPKGLCTAALLSLSCGCRAV